MLTIDDLKMFRALGGTGSLAGAAREMNVTPPALTVRLRRLEERLGIHLAVRGARGVSLTDEGRRLLDESLDLLQRIDTLPERIGGGAHALRGPLRVVAPFGFGREYIAPVLGRLHLAHADLSVTLTLSENPMADAAAHDVVVFIGAVRDSSWVGHVLAPNERFLCASPAFLRQLDEPISDPSHLSRHPCICLKENDDAVTRWRFTGGEGVEGGEGGEGREGASRVVNVRVDGALASNDGAVVTRWAVDGLGIVVRSEWEAAPLIASGALVRLLPRWRLDPAPVMALVPSRKGMSARLRRLIDVTRETLEPVPWRLDAAGRR